MNMRRKKISIFVCLLITGGYASAASTIQKFQPVAQSLNLQNARVAVISFNGAPDNPETGRSAREIVMGILVKNYKAVLVSPSKVDAYIKERSLVPSEYDYEALKIAAQDLEADIVIWGSIDQYTPYRFDRLAPATPPYIEVTLFGFRVGQSKIEKVNGRKQGKIPATIFNRQPTFNDVTQAVLTQLLARFR